ncbi:MAG: immunoglobulin domain-containing protein [bacterium]
MKIINLIILILLFTSSIYSQDNLRSKSKKLIHVGWETPYPQFIKDNQVTIENQPFEGMGIFFKFPEHDISMCVFSYEKVVQSDIQEQLDILKNIKWKKFTDNFIWVFTADVSTTRDFDWFSDSQWATIIDNTKLLSKIVNEAGLKGIFFDTENYYNPQPIHPWCITEKYAGKDYKTIGKKVRQRGKEFITALQSEKSDIIVFTTFIYSYLAQDSTGTYSPLAKFFCDGMLEGLNKSAQIIDGLEVHYWARLTYEFPYATNYSKRTVLENKFVAKDVEHIYKSNVATSAGLFTNHILAIDAGQEGYGNNKLDTKTKLEWLEHNVYNAMLNNDEYVWLYNQGDCNWWKDFPLKNEAIEAINSAKSKIQYHEALGFTLDNSDQSKINEIGFYITKSDTILDINTNDFKREYYVGDSIKVNIQSNDFWANYVRCYINGQIVNQIAFAPFNYMFDTLQAGVYDIYATGYTQTGKLIQSNYITIEVKPKVNIFKIANHTKELISCIGSEDNFIVCVAESSPNYEANYQWYKDGIELVGKNSPILKFSYFDYPTSGIYKCKVTAEGFAKILWSGDIPVYALSLPEITDQPKEVINAQIGGTYAFEVKAHYRGKTPPYLKDSFQWYKLVSGNSEPTALVDNDKFGGTTSSILTINGLGNQDICQKGEYYIVEIISQCGSVHSNPFIISQKPEVVFSEHLKNTEVCPGSDVVLTANAIAPQGYNVTYFWKKDNAPITDNAKYNGANTAKLQIFNATLEDAGYYRCVAEIASDGISVESLPAQLTIKAIPTAEPLNGITDFTIKRGEDVAFKVELIRGFEPLSIKWSFNGEVIKEGVWDKFNGDKLLTLSLESINENQAGEYICSLDNECAKTEIKFNLTVTKWDEAGITDVVSENGYSLFTAIPNPIKEITSIKYSMPKSGLVKFTLSDISGRVIRNLFEGNANEGINSLQINVKQLGLPAGVYFYTMTSDGFSGVRSFVVE